MVNENYQTEIIYAGDELFIGTSASGHSITLDTKGDRNSAPSPLELLLIAVGSCTGVDVVSILEKKRCKIDKYKVIVTADRRETYPRSFEKINVHHIVYGSHVSEQAFEQAIKLSDEKYCSVADALRPKAQITTTFEIIEMVK